MADIDDAQGKSGPRDDAKRESRSRREADALEHDAQAIGRDAEAIGREALALGSLADRRFPFWETEATVLAALLLDLGLPNRLTIGPRWLLPSVEGLLVIGLRIASPQPKLTHATLRRQVAMALIGLVSAVNLYSLGQLVHYLLQGGKAGGKALILAGAVLWGTNVLLFGLWYWELDRGGPVRRILIHDAQPDFLFPQMTEARFAPKDWIPGLIDYLYVSFTNATAFSPTDTMPLTAMAKTLMAVQALAALVTVGLVVARAVNILNG
ncbi:MAG TPA: hypothetical protein VG388_11640 [Solirubrobacteraceae bacterium]|jgi:hypothetical protein|nr:hypothetical protein [Solirubrobacteraceae bacterium]